MSAEEFDQDLIRNSEEGCDKENQRRADAIFTCKPEIRNGAIENYGDVWVILNVSQEELEDFFREGLEFSKPCSSEIISRNDPKPIMCLRMKNASTLLLSEIGTNSDFLLSKILSRHREKLG